jgi:hypothetical protein
MPVVTRWYIKAALIFLLLSLSLGLWLGLGASGAAVPAGFSAVFFHFLLVGWVTQMIFGVAYWMLPKYSRERPHRSESSAWWTFWLLNAGLVLRGIGEPLISSWPGSLVPTMLIVSALMQWLACVLFVANSWPRVKER